MTSHSFNVSNERLETLFWTSRLCLVSDWWHWRLVLVTPKSRTWRMAFRTRWGEWEEERQKSKATYI